MTEFARYYVTFLRELFSNIWDFIKTLFGAFANLLYYDIKDYFNILVDASNGFNILDWIVFVFVLIINVAFIALIIIRIAQAARRHHKNKKKDAEKQQHIEEPARRQQRDIQRDRQKTEHRRDIDQNAVQ